MVSTVPLGCGDDVVRRGERQVDVCEEVQEAAQREAGRGRHRARSGVSEGDPAGLSGVCEPEDAGQTGHRVSRAHRPQGLSGAHEDDRRQGRTCSHSQRSGHCVSGGVGRDVLSVSASLARPLLESTTRAWKHEREKAAVAFLPIFHL